MLLSLVLQLTAETDAELTADSGRAAQALFLQWVAERDAALAASLHESSAARPYTVSTLRSDRPRGYVASVHAGQHYWLRFTTLHDGLSQLALEVAEDLPGKKVQLAGAPFDVENVASDPAAHPWAGRSSYGDLAQVHFLGLSNPARRIALEFASPTAFHHTLTPNPSPDAGTDAVRRGEHSLTARREPETGNRKPLTGDRQPPTANRQPVTSSRQVTVPLPLPELVFGSLMARWNAFAPLALPEEVRRYAQECLAVSRYRLQTRMVRMGEAMSVGFIGQCQYTALVWDPYWLRAISLLAAYAFYSGVGIRTTVGMGQVKGFQLPVTSCR